MDHKKKMEAAALKKKKEAEVLKKKLAKEKEEAKAHAKALEK